MRRARRILLGALVGAIPGAILLLLAAPVPPEEDLTLAVFGIWLGVAGIAIGAFTRGLRR